MFQFHIGIDPNIATFGSFTLAWHGVFTALAIVVAVYVIYRGFLHNKLPVNHFDSIAFWTIVSGIIGARLFFDLDHPTYMFNHPMQLIEVNEGGLAIYGAIFGGFIGVLIMCRIYKLPTLSVIDATVLGLLLAQAIGRIGCTINGDAWGSPTSGPFAFIYTNPKDLLPANLLGVPTHPYPIYDMAMNLAIFVVIWQLRKHDLPKGMLFCWFAVLYAFGRFFITYFRQEHIWFWGLQEAQVIAILVFIAGLIGMAVLHRRSRHDKLNEPNEPVALAAD